MHIPLRAESWSFKRAPRWTDSACSGEWHPCHEGKASLQRSTGHCTLTQEAVHARSGENDSRIDSWLPVSKMPSNIHLELMHHGIIKDPSLGLNEPETQWVGETDWLYRCLTSLPDGTATNNNGIDLCFEGLDTFATVWVNGKKCHTSENSFIPYRISLSECLTANDKSLEIFVHFASASVMGKKLQNLHGQRDAWNGDPSRVFVRKPQYHYGWDWGPTLLTCGILGQPALHCYQHRLDYLRIDMSLSQRSVTVSTRIVSSESTTSRTNTGSDEPHLKLVYKLIGDAHVQTGQYGDVTTEVETIQPTDLSKGNLLTVKLTIPEDRYKLWWPVGYGEQSLYALEVTLWLCQGTYSTILDIRRKSIGFREIELVERPLKGQKGTSFYFKVNGISVFLAGSNWIPADSFPARMTFERYDKWLQLLVEGGQNAVRVWGGGFYETEDFYNLCDAKGILVWQDLMFACAAYPAELSTFRDNVHEEVTTIVKRLHHHACMAIIAGNNEDYQIAEAAGLGKDIPDNSPPDSWLKSTFPAKYFYEYMFPTIVREHSPICYHPGSPWKAGHNTRDASKGDIHQWDVWHGTQQDYQDWDKLIGRFVSEFGMHALPNEETLKHLTEADKSEWYPGSKVLDMHNKAAGGNERLSLYITKNLRYGTKMEQYMLASQIMQADALSSAFRLWRREWRGEGKEYCGGALVWQMNDVYPCISWSIADYFLRPKLSYYTIKQALQPLSINLKRISSTNETGLGSGGRTRQTHVEIWAASSLRQETFARLEISVAHMHNAKVVNFDMGLVRIAPNCSSEFGAISLPELPEEDVVVEAKLLDLETGAILARTYDWPSPLKYVKPNNATIEAKIGKGNTLVCRASLPVKALTFSVINKEACLRWLDNGIDLITGEERVVYFQSETPVKISEVVLTSYLFDCND